MKSTTGIFIFLVFFIGLSDNSSGQSISQIAEKFIDFSLDNDTLQLPARLFIPESYDEQQRYPLVITLHGSGEIGTDNTIQVNNIMATCWGKDAFQSEHPCFIFSPQSPGSWTGTKVYESVMFLLDSIIANYAIDTSRIYITGLSMGGIGTWHYLDANPEKYAAALPLCGAYFASDEETDQFVEKIRHIPLWDFHGNKDPNVDVLLSRRIIEKYPGYQEYPLYTHNHYRKAYSLDETTIENYIDRYSELIYSEVPNWGHNVWDIAYNMPLVKTWLFRQRKHAPGNILVNKQDSRARVSGSVEFTFSASGRTDSVSVWAGHIHSPDWTFIDKIEANSGNYLFDSEDVGDHPYCLLKFIAHDSSGYAIGRAYSDTLCIDNEGNGMPYVELIDDYFLEEAEIYSDNYTLKLLLGDPESEPLHLTFSVSYDYGQSFSSFNEADAEEGIYEIEIALSEFDYSPQTVIMVEVSDGENTSAASTFNFLNGNGIQSVNTSPQPIFTIFPNPAQDRLTITTERTADYTVEISSMNGQLIYTANVNVPRYQLDLAHLSKGCYILRIRSREAEYVSRIIRF